MPSPRDAQVLEFVPLVQRVVETVKTSLPPNADRDGLFGAGMIGLLQAIERFDADRGVAFEAYARLRIRGAVRDELRGRDHLTRTQRREVSSARAAVEAAERQPGADAKVEQARARLAELQIAAPPASWDPMILDDRVTATPWQEAFDVEEWLATKQRIGHMRAALCTLPDRERQLVGLYYDEDLDLAEISELCGVSVSRVSQLLTRARRHLATAMTPN